MTSAPRFAILLAVVTAAPGMACGARRLPTLATPPVAGQTLVVLLADGDGSTGRASLFNESGSVDLSAARDASLAAPNRAPTAPQELSEADVKRLFGDALAALPAAPRRFMLHFRFESDELTDESRAIVPEVLDAVRTHTAPEVAVVGHTDTMGSPAANVDLGMKRALMVRGLLVDAGLKPSFIRTTSHGEADLFVRTPDETPEPRNRRVEIAVR